MLAVEQIEINDIKMPYHSAYVYTEEIEYISEPKRSMTGKIPSWPTYYFIPTINVVWNYLSHADFQKLMNAVRTPDFKMKYFDTNNGVYKTGRFYCSSSSYNAMVAKLATVRGYEGISLKFICTNNPVEVSANG